MAEMIIGRVRGDTGPKGDKGDKGDQGDPFTYEDLTSAQKAELRANITKVSELTNDSGFITQDGLAEATETFSTGDTSTNPEYTNNVTLLQSGETHSMIFRKISLMFANIRYLINKLGATAFTGSGKNTITALLGGTSISSIGNGTLTGAVSTLNSSISTLNTSVGTLNTSVDTLNSSKVDKTTPEYNLNTSAASGTTDGDLYAAITTLGWESEVID